MTQWSTLGQSLVQKINDRTVTHAVFTTFGFEPEFFESTVVPYLLPQLEGLSMHVGLRRLQMERVLQQYPVAMDVYFDQKVREPMVPWLPYHLQPVATKGAFHGKIILLRLQDEKLRVTWLLGAGSANLTKAGWLENIETFYFADEFDMAAIPAGVHPDLQNLLDYLDGLGKLNSNTQTATQFFLKELKEGQLAKQTAGEPQFVALLPGREQQLPQQFIARLASYRAEFKREIAQPILEVISPYFPDSNALELVKNLMAGLKVAQLRLWLPEALGINRQRLALVKAATYADLLSANEKLEKGRFDWSYFGEKALAEQSASERTPRFLHAKVFRIPGELVFMGSVNFSYMAFDVNFEAGFLMKDLAESWLIPLPVGQLPSDCMEPEINSSADTGADDAPAVLLGYDWRTQTLKAKFLSPAQAVYALVDAAGNNVGPVLGLEVEEEIKFTLADDVRSQLESSLQVSGWLRLKTSEAIHAVWVQQTNLECRPLPAELNPGIWEVMNFWRSLDQGQNGKNLTDFIACLEKMLKQRPESMGEDMPVFDGPEKDIFTDMAAVHAGFYQLDNMLKGEKCTKKTKDYYLTALRPDTLPTLLNKLEEALTGQSENPPDLVEQWVILHWIKQILTNSRQSSQELEAQTDTLLKKVEDQPLFQAIDKKWLTWLSAMFLCSLGTEDQAASEIKQEEFL